jgi:hypothetical protein
VQCKPRSRAAASGFWLPPIGPIKDFHLRSFIHAQRTQSGQALLPFRPPPLLVVQSSFRSPSAWLLALYSNGDKAGVSPIIGTEGPGSQAPTGPRGTRTEVQSTDTGDIVHHDPYGTRYQDGSVTPPHYGVERDGQPTIHQTYPSPHDPRTNR